MAETVLAGEQQRLVSLDAFRGLTIASMVLVNNPGSWAHMYAPLGHAQWDGWTPTDFVFPFFLFIVGVAMTFSFDKRIGAGADRWRMFAHVVRRSAILIILGFSIGAFSGGKWWNMTSYAMMLAGFWFVFSREPLFSFGETAADKRNKLLGWGLLGGGVILFLASLGEFGSQRIPGVLQRIAWCYFGVSIIMLLTSWKGRLLWAIVIVWGYWIIMRYFDAPEGYEMARRDPPEGVPFPGKLNDWLDTQIFGDNLYRRRPDPEGLLSTLPAMATVLVGTLTGTWLKTAWERRDKVIGMACMGGVLILAGLCMETFFPINKKIWSSSFVVFTAGWAMTILAVCYYFIDVQMWKRWSLPLVVFGTNAILLFWASTIMALTMSRYIRFTVDEETIALRTWLYRNIYTANIETPELASFMWGISYVILWCLLLYPLYRKKIFLKV